MSSKRSIRRGQLVSPFGVGAILDVGSESFAVTDISRWNTSGLSRIQDSRLENKLRNPIRTPSGKESEASVTISRFPRWQFCPKCRRMRRISSAEDQARKYKPPKCEHCSPSVEMTPMGFVTVCAEGHLGDVDWYIWAHRQRSTINGVCSRQTSDLYFETSGRGGGDWSSIRVRCGCGAYSDFSGLVQVEAPAGMRCGGGQPWKKERSLCASSVWVYRRAASNLHFPSQVSALDLALAHESEVQSTNLVQTWMGDGLYGVIEMAHAHLKDLDRTLAAVSNQIERFAERHGCTVDAARSALALALSGEDEATNHAESEEMDSPDFRSQILREEWAVLANGRDVAGNTLQIRRNKIPPSWSAELKRTVQAVSMVRRLREVRALIGFRRLSPSTDNPLVPVDLGTSSSRWYPGVEAWGEGIFIQLSEPEVAAWEQRVRATMAVKLARMAPKVAAMGWDESMCATRFLLLHSLAHAIVRRLSFDAGYSASSIRERIYSAAGSQPMCGILIYTADGDSEGSLGGLVRMGDPGRFGALLQSALQDMAWCSADPVCRETEVSGLDGLNAASCHACVLVSETSCSYNNSALDRRTLVRIGEIEPFFNVDELVRSGES